MSRRGESVGSSSQGTSRGQSVVADRGVHRTTCGYCNSGSSTRISHGLSADRVSVDHYQALEEIKWVQAAQKHCSTLQYYYLGYYIHSCPKMRYKAAYNPSELLCAVHYQWTPFQLAKPVLDKAAYLCFCDVCGHAEPILSPSNDEMHDINGQDDHEMEDNLELRDGELHEFQSSGGSDHSMGVEDGVEAPAVDFDAEDIGGV